MKFFYTYVLRSIKDQKLYYGFTENINLRIEQHNNGKVTSTKHRIPLELIYFVRRTLFEKHACQKMMHLEEKSILKHIMETCSSENG